MTLEKHLPEESRRRFVEVLLPLEKAAEATIWSAAELQDAPCIARGSIRHVNEDYCLVELLSLVNDSLDRVGWKEPSVPACNAATKEEKLSCYKLLARKLQNGNKSDMIVGKRVFFAIPTLVQGDGTRRKGLWWSLFVPGQQVPRSLPEAPGIA